ncbi:MAG TPA: hypothetical protein VE007_01775, partial [Thermoanaerobaculia bacterium]|nr:hypothetical protein [Thermoanaerobaculia bacterium]
DTASGQSFTYIVKSAGPVISSVTSGSGTVSISGANFTNISTVAIGGRAASFTVISSTSISATPSGITAPGCPSGVAVGTLVSAGDVVVTNAFGCAATATGAFLLPCAASPADIAIAKTSNPASVSLAGSTAVSYNLALTNPGGSSANGVIVTDTLPAGVTFVSCSSSQGSCSFGGGTVTANIGTVPPTGNASVTINVTMVGPARTVSNTANVSTTSPETNTANNTSTATTVIGP